MAHDVSRLLKMPPAKIDKLFALQFKG